MDQPVPFGFTQEPLDDEERELMDPDSWDWDNPVEVIVAENLLAELGIQLTYEEHVAIGKAAHAQGIPTHTFIKHAALAAARGEESVVGTAVSAAQGATP